MFGRMGVMEIVLILVLFLLLFGAKRIPLIARGLGQGIRNFKAGVKEPERLENGDASGRGDDGRIG
jgi:sec-independent protein translocase protein TatA